MTFIRTRGRRQKLPGNFDLDRKIIPTRCRRKYFENRDGFLRPRRLIAMTEDEPPAAPQETAETWMTARRI
jgi:hypothetical protein